MQALHNGFRNHSAAHCNVMCFVLTASAAVRHFVPTDGGFTTPRTHHIRVVLCQGVGQVSQAVTTHAWTLTLQVKHNAELASPGRVEVSKAHSCIQCVLNGPEYTHKCSSSAFELHTKLIG